MGISKTTRRDILKNFALSVTLGGMSVQAAQHMHEHVAAVKQKSSGVYKPKFLNTHEFKTLARLSEIIIPADEVSGSALEAGAPEFIDLISANNDEIGTIFMGGLQWLDLETNKRYGATFLDSKPAQQTEILDLIAYRKNADQGLAAGVRFFDWTRRLVTDAFYTSPIGVKDVDYRGNKGMSVFQVPASAIAYAVKRSGLA